MFFQFKSGSGFNIPAGLLNQNINAVLTFSATANGSPASNAGGSPTQQFLNTNFTFTSVGTQTIGSVTIAPGTNLLTATNTAGSPPIAALLSGSVQSSNFSAPVATFPNNIVFTSAFINFAGNSNQSFAYSLTPGLTAGGAGPGLAINPFTAIGTGVFAATAPTSVMLTITTTNLPDAVNGQPYSIALATAGGQGAVSWTLAAGSVLPEGFTLSTGGVLSSAANSTAKPGTYLFTVVATDSTGATAQRQLSLNVIQQPKLVLTQATTLDAQSVTVDYTISGADISKPLQFDVYRSTTPVMDSTSELINTEVIFAPSDALRQGVHSETLIPGTPLPPNPAKPYIVVVANGGNAVSEDPSSVNVTYFHKYLLGGIVRGLSFSDVETLAWMNQMKSDLLQIPHFDDVITHNWTGESKLPLPGLTVAAGNDMYSQLISATLALKQRVSHPGDVVDIHLFGHSRGTVVVSQVLNDMAAQVGGAFVGSYVEATLLDIHPANPAEDNLFSFTVPDAALATLLFQDLAQDPEITLPNFPGLMSVDIWYQHTRSIAFIPFRQVFESVLNLWGESQNNNGITNLNPNLIPQWHDLTSKTYTTASGTSLVGHTEVHEYFCVGAAGLRACKLITSRFVSAGG